MGHARTKKSAALRALVAAAALSGFMGAAGATDLKEDARNAAIGDGLSTVVGLAAGAAEMNPLGPVLAIGMKTVVFSYVETLPDTERPRAYALATSTWSAATANNICVTAAVLTGGSFAPACLVLGVAWGIKTWNDSEAERQFWEGCALLRVYAQEPDLECVYTRPAAPLVAVADESFITAQGLRAP